MASRGSRVNPVTVATDVWSEIVGQSDALAQLRSSSAQPVHAYMFLGPHGSGRWPAAKAFAALILGDDLAGEAAERATRLALRGEHPDLVKIDPAGNLYRDDEVQFLITEASRTPVEGTRKVIVADRFHTANTTVIGRLLKTLEEPPASTIIILLNEDLPDEQITIASRCVVIRFQAVAHADAVAWLIEQGVEADRAETVALASGGDMRRACDLCADEHVVERHEAWRSVPSRLDGSGASVAVAVEELRALIDDAQGPIDARHRVELEALGEREEQVGARGSGRRDLEASQKREVRRLRVDELKFGFATLAGFYRDSAVAAPRTAHLEALDALRDANDALRRNPNEALLMQALFLRLAEA